MKLNSVISKPVVMTEKAATKFMNEKNIDEYQLVDVRMQEEYEDEHLPGALLIPLNELTQGKNQLDPDKPTIVYCRSGGRSQAAAQWLAGQHFKEVYDISYHIRDWLGTQAVGDSQIDLHLIVPDTDYQDIWGLAYAMEEGLQLFYLKLEEKEPNAALKAVYHELAGFEDYHKNRLLESYAANTGAEADLETLTKPFRDAMEGGELNKHSPHEIISKAPGVLDIFGMSMAIEAQSYDLYTRLSRKSEQLEAKKLLEEMADEEKQHLSFITDEMRKYLNDA